VVHHGRFIGDGDWCVVRRFHHAGTATHFDDACCELSRGGPGVRRSGDPPGTSLHTLVRSGGGEGSSGRRGLFSGKYPWNHSVPQYCVETVDPIRPRFVFGRIRRAKLCRVLVLPALWRGTGNAGSHFLLGERRLRFSISQMDVPARQSYIMAVVPAEERSAAGGFTGVARTTGAAISPLFVGFLFAKPSLISAPFFIAGTLKIVYDLLLYKAFVAIKPPEEQSRDKEV
jgi:hypothetical protein